MIYTTTKFEVIGKPECKDWKLTNGNSGTTYKLNVAQNNGVDVATIKCPQKVYDTVCRGDVADFLCSFSDYGDKQEFKIVEIVKFDTAGNVGQSPVNTPAAGKPAGK